MHIGLVVAIVLVALGLGSYVFLMIFYPEWVVISGKTTKKAINAHKEGGTSEDHDIFPTDHK